VNEAQPGGVEEGELAEVDDDERLRGSTQVLGKSLTRIGIEFSPQGYDATGIDVVRVNDNGLHQSDTSSTLARAS
jgi:hypothetical protein